MADFKKDRSPQQARLKTFDVGLWRVVYDDSEKTSKSWMSWMHDSLTRLRQFRDVPVIRFFRDVYTLDPFNFALSVISRCLSGVEQSLLVYWSTRIFSLAETGFSSGTLNRRAVLVALTARLGLSIFVVLWRRWTAHADAVLQTQVRMHFQQELLQARCTDLQDHFDTTNDDHTTSVAPPLAWGLLFRILELAQSMLSLFSQLCILLTLAWTREDGTALLIICLAKPLYSIFFVDDPFGRPYFAYAYDKAFRRMSSMWKIAMDPYYAKEIAACSLTDFLMAEYERARLALRGVAEQAPYALTVQKSAFTEVFVELLGPLPMIYIAGNLLIYARSVPLSSILVINESSFAFSNLFISLSLGMSSLTRDLSDIKGMYSRIDSCAVQRATRRRMLPYPLPDLPTSLGMGITFSGVSFQYPGSQTGQYALRNVSFTIAPSSMVVIVGQNGSGKSSLANLLTGLCQPGSGDIFIDGVKSSFFRREDLAQATASLTQDHRVLPLTIAENIGLGSASEQHNIGRICEAAALGGATGFISKFPDGLDHSLDVLRECFSYGALPDGPLADFAREFRQSTDISGGERQRLVAARTFMRLLSQKTKLVVADEPSAAIDPIGEYELFEKLRMHRKGKTMVFISHRFGYLTKHADQILCMKEGQLVEAGTHAELMALDGEYRRLYDVQARAFADDIDVSPLCDAS